MHARVVIEGAILLRHPQWRSRHLCVATISGEALSASGPTMPMWPPPLRHSSWRCTIFCVATVNGDAKRGYFFEIVSAKVYYLKSFQVWVNFV
jgi:hypothetical protein